MLELKNISKTFNAGTVNQKVALNGLNLTMNEGDFVTVIGGNGAGKSTMLNAIAGVFQVDTGKILIDGVDVTALPTRAAFRSRARTSPSCPSTSAPAASGVSFRTPCAALRRA